MLNEVQTEKAYGGIILNTLVNYSKCCKKNKNKKKKNKKKFYMKARTYPNK